MPITVLFADDSDVLRRVLSRFLEDFADEVEVVGEAPTFSEAIQMTQELRPQVLLMDLHLYDDDDVQMPAEELKARLHPYTLLLVMSYANDAKAKDIAQSIGAIGFLDKMTLVNDLVPAILRIAAPKVNAAD